MPTYKYEPTPGEPRVSIVNEKLTVSAGDPFVVDHYFSDYVATKERYTCQSDDPYISPIKMSFTGSGTNAMTVNEDIGSYVDIIVHTPEVNSVRLFFNGDDTKSITIYGSGSGTIFRGINTSKIRIINSVGTGNYSIALIDSREFSPSNNY